MRAVAATGGSRRKREGESSVRKRGERRREAEEVEGVCERECEGGSGKRFNIVLSRVVRR